MFGKHDITSNVRNVKNMCENEKPPCRQITTLHTYKTEYNADSVEWCPHEPNRNVLVCANYQLKESESSDKRERFGRILLFSVTEDDLILHQTIETAAVLDQKWCHNQINDRSFLAVANAQKTLEIYSLDPETVQLELITSCQVEDDESETLLLSLDWSTGKNQSNEPELVCSDSKGNIHRFRYNNEALIREQSWHAHEFEAWITGFYYWDPNIVFSGGDDCTFLKFDKRMGTEPVARNRIHEAGVTSMHSNPSREFIFATGSYDTNARLWDIRYMKNCINSIEMPGTLWRLKWDPFYHDHLLAACMLGGIHIVHVETSKDLRVVDSYYEHKNIAYGADWSYLPIDLNGDSLMGTCSFYDNLLCVSKVKIRQ